MEENVLDTLHKMDADLNGFLHVADDGVARSYNGNATVIDYVRLTNEQLMQLLSQLPESYQSEMNHLHSTFDNVSGFDVADESQLRDPPSWLRPPPQHDAIKRSVSSQTRNPARRAESTLEVRDYFCVGQPCTNSAACQFLGCSACVYLDAVLPGGGGICAR